MRQPAALRHDRDEGRRRRGLGGARRAADRRVRLCLEPAGRGRDPAAAGKGRQGPRRDHRPAATSSTSSSTAPIPGPRSTASARASRPSTRCCPIRRCAQALGAAGRPQVGARITSTAAPASRPANFVNNPERFRSKNDEVRVQRRQGEPDSSRRPAGRRGRRHPGQGRQEAEVRLPDLDQHSRARRPRRSSSRPARRPASTSELKSVTASVFFSSDVANPDTYTKFYCDIQMYTTTMTQPDPETFMNQFTSVGGRHQGEQVAGPQHHALAATRSTTRRSARPKASSIRSSARPCSSA